MSRECAMYKYYFEHMNHLVTAMPILITGVPHLVLQQLAFLDD